MGNTTWLLNKNVNNDGDEQDPEFTFVFNYGVNTAFFVSENFGFELDAIFGNFSQKYNGRVQVLGSDQVYESRVDMKTMQLPFLLKFGSDATFELGVQYTKINSVTYHNDNNSAQLPYVFYTPYGMNGEIIDVSDEYGNSFFSFVIGFGGNVPITDQLLINTGIRFAYSLSDVKGLDGFGNPLKNPDDLIYNSTFGMYDKYEKTNTAHAGFRLGLTYRFEN